MNSSTVCFAFVVSLALSSLNLYGADDNSGGRLVTVGDHRKNRTPRWADTLLRILLKPRDRNTVAGDLLEEYAEVVLPKRGRLHAQLWYFKQLASLVDGISLGLFIGVVFGIWNLVATWLHPLADETSGALLMFYGPMFLAWGFSGFTIARRSGRLTRGIKSAATMACVTFAVFYIANLVRVNVFLESIQHRADWQNLIIRFHASGSESLRAFVNYDYIKGAPFKIGVASAIGGLMGLLGGLVASVVKTWNRFFTP